MIFRIYPSKDTTITNWKRSGIQQTGSNIGLAETLAVFKQAGLSGTTGVPSTASVGRLITQFDLSSIAQLTASAKAPSNGISYRFVMRNCQHDRTLPYSYDMEILQLAQDWDEGRGVDADWYVDKGYANWIQPKRGQYWSNPGGDVTGSTVPFHLDQGDEDLDVDVGRIVGSWLTGGLPNYGFMIRVSSSLESNNEFNDYYLKKFFGRSTHFPDKRPFIEASWDDSIKDDRHNFVFDNTGSLYVYNIVRGALTNIPGVGTGNIYVKISDASGTIKFLTGSYAGSSGVYSASFALASASYSGSLFTDVWFSGSNVYMTSSFGVADSFLKNSVPPTDYFVSIGNMKNQYSTHECVRFDLFVRPHDYAPSVLHTASLDYTGMVVTKAYYQITNDRTDEVVVPFGTGSVETTRLSYDGNGNYFNFYMRSLSPGNVYRIVFLFDVDGQQQIIDQGFKFRLV